MLRSPHYQEVRLYFTFFSHLISWLLIHILFSFFCLLLLVFFTDKLIPVGRKPLENNTCSTQYSNFEKVSPDYILLRVMPFSKRLLAWSATTWSSGKTNCTLYHSEPGQALLFQILQVFLHCFVWPPSKAQNHCSLQLSVIVSNSSAESPFFQCICLCLLLYLLGHPCFRNGNSLLCSGRSTGPLKEWIHYLVPIYNNNTALPQWVCISKVPRPHCDNLAVFLYCFLLRRDWKTIEDHQ